MRPAKAMRLIDSDIELVACGSSNSRMPTFGAWESDGARAVLRRRWTTSRCTAYYEELDGDPLSFLASAVDMDHFIEAVIATSRRGRGQDQEPEAHQPQLRRVERLVRPPLLQRPRPGQGPAVAAAPPHHRGRLHHHRRCRRRHLAQLTAAAWRPSHGRLPGSADQRHRTARAPSQAATHGSRRSPTRSSRCAAWPVGRFSR